MNLKLVPVSLRFIDPLQNLLYMYIYVAFTLKKVRDILILACLSARKAKHHVKKTTNKHEPRSHHCCLYENTENVFFPVRYPKNLFVG